jgi:hypothetical protein
VRIPHNRRPSRTLVEKHYEESRVTFKN